MMQVAAVTAAATPLLQSVSGSFLQFGGPVSGWDVDPLFLHFSPRVVSSSCSAPVDVLMHHLTEG